MTAQLIDRAASNHEDWNASLPPGATYRLDPMHFPYPLSPLTSSTLGPAFGSGATAAFRELNAPIEAVHVIHRNHYRFELWLPMMPATEDEARRIGEAAEATMKQEIGRLMDRWNGEHLPLIAAHLRRLQEMNIGTASPAELNALLDEAHAIHKDLWTIHFRIAIPMLMSMQLFDELYADLFGGSHFDSHALLVGGFSESVKAGIGLSALAHVAEELGVADAIRDSDPQSAPGILEQSANGRAFLTQLNEYLEAYGLRQDLFEFSIPTWREDPSFAIANIRNYIETGHDARKEQAEMASFAARALEDARGKLSSYPDAVRGQFEAFVQFGRHGAFLQEEHNFHIDQRGMAILRLLYLRVGQRFVDAGLLQAPDDIFLLTIDEIQRVIGRRFMTPAKDLQSLVQQRGDELAHARTLSPPPFVGEAPAGPPPDGDPMMRALGQFFGGPPQQADEPNQLKGNGGSRGVASGVARVARSLEEAKDLLPGEILVAVTTMPAWTPLFGVAAAVVTETGGPLSHCAIVAREYGIPSVVGAFGATQRIATGQRVSVDGGTGVITLLD